MRLCNRSVLQQGDFEVSEGRVLAAQRAAPAWVPGLSPAAAPVAPQADALDTEDLLATARARAKAIIETARQQAARLASEACAAARAEAERRLAEATVEAARIREEGRASGLEEGRAAARQEVERALALAAAIDEAKREYLRACEAQVVDLALSVAERIVGQQLAIDREAVCEMADRALSLAGTSENYQIHVSPADAEIVRQHLEAIGRSDDVQLVIDVSVEDGGCVVSASHGRVDAQISSQIDEVRRAFLGGD